MSGKKAGRSSRNKSKMLPVEVMGISVCPPYQGYVVIIQEVGSDRRLPIFIGVAEAQAISILLQDLEYARPLTFDLFSGIIRELGAEVVAVRITELKENTFYAEVELKGFDGRIHFIDARPSDSVALALKTKAPVFVAESVMASAAIQSDQMPESDIDKIAELNQQLQAAVAEEAYERAAQIRDEIHALERKRIGDSQEKKGNSSV